MKCKLKVKEGKLEVAELSIIMANFYQKTIQKSNKKLAKSMARLVWC